MLDLYKDFIVFGNLFIYGWKFVFIEIYLNLEFLLFVMDCKDLMMISGNFDFVVNFLNNLLFRWMILRIKINNVIWCFLIEVGIKDRNRFLLEK